MWRTRSLPAMFKAKGDAIMTRPARAGKAGAPAHPTREHSMLRQNAASHRQNRWRSRDVMMRFGQGGKKDETDEATVQRLCAALGSRSVALVGMPGCGKSAVGRRLAPRLGMSFVDADEEIERAAGKPITDIFKDHGEPYFRDGERRVIARLLAAGPQVLATGGGAFMVAETRENIRRSGISVWLKAELPLLMRRVPFVFCTGYEMVDPEGRFPDAPVIRKPASAQAVSAALHDLLSVD